MTREAAVALACATLVLATASSPRTAQGPSPQDQRPPVFRGGVNFVYVDVYPRRDGRLVEGLSANDFQVSEDGKPQHVETFEFIRIEPNAPDTERRDPNTKEDGDQLAADPRHRVFVIYLDIYHTTFAGAHYARQPLFGFLDRTIGPSDVFGVMTPEVPIQQLVFGRRTDTIEAEMTKYFDWGLKGQPVFPRSSIEEQLLICDAGRERLVRLYREDLMATSLEDLMVHLRDLRDERKNVLLVSEGWNPLPEQRALLNTARGTIPPLGPDPGGRLGIGVQQPGMRNASWCDQQIGRLANIDFQRRFRDLLSLANRANVSFYPVDVGGLKTNMPDASVSRAPTAEQVIAQLDAAEGRLDTLRTLAENTDGRAIVNTNDIGGGFRSIADDLSAYYLLGYSSTNTNLDGKFRRIDVKVNQSRVSVAARRGYLAPVPTPARPASAPSPPAALTGELGRLARLRIDAELFTYGVASSGGLDVVAEIAGQEIERGRWRNGAMVQVVVEHPGGESLTAAGRIEPGARGALLHVPLDTPQAGPWRASVRVSGDDGSLDDRLEISAPPASLLGAPVCFRGTASARVPLRPVADFQFRRTERVHAEWPILAPLDQRTVRVLDRRGQPLALGAAVTEQDRNGQSVAAVDLGLSPVSDGDYVLELQVGRGAEAERHLLAFRVVR